MNKYLIVRFSSFGDIAQALPAAEKIRELDPTSEIHFLTRDDFGFFVKSLGAINKVWALNRAAGFNGLRTLVEELKEEKYTRVYDAHNNMRSLYVVMRLFLNNFGIKIVRRTKSRFKRFLLFKLRINLFPKPFRGAASYIRPLLKWFPNITLPENLHLKLVQVTVNIPENFPLSHCIVLAPSATWEMKRWPTDYWVQLVRDNPQTKFVVLGGPDDQHCDTIANAGGSRVLNLKGQLTWLQSAKVVSLARAVVSGDTGILHLADIMGKDTIALIGPTAFGYPSRMTSTVLESKLSCKPCTKDGRGRCINSTYQLCLKQITPAKVSDVLRSFTA